MRNQYLSQYVPKILELGLEIPDPELKKNEETGEWTYSDPNWDEFYEVIKGNGPCNAERLDVRKWAEENGKWVREALEKAEEKHVIPLA